MSPRAMPVTLAEGPLLGVSSLRQGAILTTMLATRNFSGTCARAPAPAFVPSMSPAWWSLQNSDSGS